jgi:hypothetical protein
MTMIDGPGRLPPLPHAVDLAQPGIARTYSYLLGGKDHFTADRELAHAILTARPEARLAALENRRFLGRAAEFLTAQAGIRQFLDIGAGLPAGRNVHEIAQAIEPASRVAYVDNDPMVIAHARALMPSGPAGRTGCVQGDLRDPAAILADPVIRDVLDLAQPVALLLLAVLPFVPDEDRPGEAITALLDALPAGSYVAASHPTAEHDPQGTAAVAEAYRKAGIPVQFRDSGEFARLVFPGMELMPPGVVPVSQWRPASGEPPPSPAEVSCYAGVARKQ